MKSHFQFFHFKTSINRFLLISILSFTTLYISAIYFLSQRQALHEIEELFDAQLAQSSYILLNLLGDSVATIDQSSKHLPVVYYGLDANHVSNNNENRNRLLYQKKVAYQIWNNEGKLLIKSGSAPDHVFGPNQIGYSRITLAAAKNNDVHDMNIAINEHGEIENLEIQSWRVFTLYDDDWNFWLHVAESESIRNELAQGISRQTVLPGLIMLPLALMLLIFIIRFGLRPLKQLARNIKQREAHNLSAITLDHTPKEIQPVLEALNDLFSRLDGAIKREQRLTADAAHELRTPLAVIMIHAQNALNSRNDVERNEALKELEQGMQRVSRLLEQLLSLSKISPETIPLEPTNLYLTCQDMIAQMAPKVLAKQQDIALECDEKYQGVKIEASVFLLEILLRNLIDNASQYTPKSGEIVVSLQQQNHHLMLTVEDSGSGVAGDQLDKLTDRFYREHQQAGNGAGLGLSLVKSIVEFHQGDLKFSHSHLGGLKIEISFKNLV